VSTVAYANLTNKRDLAPRGTSVATSPGIGTYADTLTALVPGEVLGLHAFIMSWATTTSDNITSISDAQTLYWAFWGCAVLSMFLFILPRLGCARWDEWDIARMFIPPITFTGWTMLQRISAFDVVWPSLGKTPRNAIAAGLAIILAAVTPYLAYKADQKQAPGA